MSQVELLASSQRLPKASLRTWKRDFWSMQEFARICMAQWQHFRLVYERLPPNLCCSEACHVDLLQHFGRTRLMFHGKEINRALKETKEGKNSHKQNARRCYFK